MPGVEEGGVLLFVGASNDSWNKKHKLWTEGTDSIALRQGLLCMDSFLGSFKYSGVSEASVCKD